MKEKTIIWLNNATYNKQSLSDSAVVVNYEKHLILHYTIEYWWIKNLFLTEFSDNPITIAYL